MTVYNKKGWVAVGAVLLLGTLAGCGDPFNHSLPGEPATVYLSDAGGGGDEGGAVSYGTAYAILNDNCSFCHNESGAAAGTKLHVTSDSAADYAAIAALVDVENPDNSKLIKKPTGQASHGGGSILKADSAETATIRAWIAAGAHNN